MKSVVGRMFIIASLAAVPALAIAAAPQTVATPDSKLDERIEAKIGATSLKAYGIDVSVDGGVATLKGAVATDADRRKAEELAKIQGVVRVDNQLTVDPAAPTNTAVEAVTGATKAGAEKTKAGVEKVVDKTKDGLSKTGEVITDAWITSRVSAKFIDEDSLKGSDINVDTTDHVVTLRGTVMSEAGRARALEQAKEVEGVSRVVSQLTIGPKK